MLSSNTCSRFITGFNAFKTDYSFKETAANTMYDLEDFIIDKYDKNGENLDIDAGDEFLQISCIGKVFLVSSLTPRHQIWVSSPVSGSLKFDYDSEINDWVDHNRPQYTIKTELSYEIQEAFGFCE